MTRFHWQKRLPILLFPFILGEIAAESPDHRLLSLVPPGAPIVAGISTPSARDRPDNFVLMTQNNWFDLGDFFALTGADDTRIIQQEVFVAMVSKEGKLDEHSLILSGHFDKRRIFKSVADGGAAETNYRGIPILVIQPLARERGTFNDVRWLAILDSSVLVFSTISSARLELDRYLEHSQTDETLLLWLARLRRKDQTWSVLSPTAGTLSPHVWAPEIRRVLALLSPELADLAQPGNGLEFGLYYGRRVEFEYEVAIVPTAASRVRTDSLGQFPVEPAKSASLLSALDKARDANTRHGVIVVSTSRYKTWLAEIRGQRIPSN